MAPVIVFILVIAICGILGGVLGFAIDPIMTDATAMDRIMSFAWPGTFLIILIFSISWLLMRAQKSRGGFNY